MNDNKCQKCGGPTDCLSGASAHPDNWYCENESGCGWRAWENRGSSSASPTGSVARWVIGEKHPIYGEVQMMGRIGGEEYRWFVKDNLVSMIPLENC